MALTSVATRPLQLRLRPDLRIERSRHLGREQVVIKDPIGLKYFRFEREEFALLQRLDGRSSLEDIQRDFQVKFRPQTVSTDAIYGLVCRAHSDALVVSDAPGQGEQLQNRHLSRRRQGRREALTNVLCIRFRGVDPGRLLDWLTRRAGWIFSPPAVATCLAMAIVALLIVAVEFATFRTRLPEFQAFFAAENWIWFALTLAVTKILHELGHGVACKRFGGECHEMGVMLLALTPCLYCNVSDAWTMPSRWHRIAIAAAGMYVELILASICTLLWWSTDAGPLNSLCLAVMFVCSVGTLALNANPLMRYDGYYILSDWVQIPNLRQKASLALRGLMARLTLAPRPVQDPCIKGRRRWMLAAYAVAASVYRWLVLFSILGFLFCLFEPFGLKTVGRLIACLAVYGLLVQPLWRLIRSLTAPRVNTFAPSRRALLGGGALTLSAVAVLLMPFPYHVRCDMRVELRDAATVLVDVPGTVAEVCVRPGSCVQAGQILMTLHNVDAELLADRLSSDQQRLAIKLDGLRKRSLRGDTTASAEVESTAEALASISRQLETARGELARLSLVARRGGTVFRVDSDRLPGEQGALLPFRSDSPLQPSSVGAYLEQGTVVCRIGDPRLLTAVLEIDESAAELICPDAVVRLFPNQTPGRGFSSSRVQNLSEQTMSAGGVTAGACYAGFSSPAAHSGPTPRRPVACLATCDFEDPDSQLVIGGRGRARILVGYWTLTQRIWRWWQT